MNARRSAARLAVVALLLGAVPVVVGAVRGDSAAPPPMRKLPVAAAGRNPTIEAAAIALVRAQAGTGTSGAGTSSAGPRTSDRRDALARLVAAPRIAGLVQPRPHVVVAVVTDAVQGVHGMVDVVSVVTLLDQPDGYRAVDALTACDPAGDGLAFSIPAPGAPVLVVVGAEGTATLPFGGEPVVGVPDEGVHAWVSSELDDHDPAAVRFGGSPDDRLCTGV